MSGADDPESSIHVLYVDDDRGLLDVTEAYLERTFENISVETAPSARQGLELLGSTGENGREEPFDVVVSDYQMPEINGLEFLEAVRKEHGDTLPFIIFTGRGREEVAIDALNLGANRYLQKGGDPTAQYEVLAQAIEQEVTHARTQHLVEKHEREFRTILESIMDAVVATDANGRVTRLNRAAEDLTGWPNEDAVGEPIGTVVSAYDLDTDEPADLTAETGSDRVVRHIDGTERIVTLRRSPRRDAEGAVVGTVVVLHDITEAHERQQQLASKSQRLGHLIEQSPLAVIEWDLDFRVTRWNETAAKMFGYTAAEALGKHADFIIPLDQRGEVEKVWTPLISASQPTTHSMNTNITADGTQIDCEWHNRAITDDDGRTIAVLSMVQDLTEQRQHTRHLQAIAERTTEAIFIKNLDGRYEFINEAGAAFLGRPPEAVVGRTDRELFDLPPGETHLWTDRKVLETGEPVVEDECVMVDGKEHVFHSEKYPYHDAGGEIVGVMGISRDVTEETAVRELLEMLHATVTDADMHPDRRIEQLVEAARIRIDADTAHLGRVDEASGTYEVITSVGKTADWPVGRVVPMRDLPTRKALTEPGITIDHVERVGDGTDQTGAVTKTETAVFAAAPVFLADEFWGLVCFEGAEDTVAHIDGLGPVVELIADSVGCQLHMSQP
ncbi:PAS domain S-box protein [Haloarchaeobius sp. TZWWS8]|uniref:PAS domain S-box protein n=1 Tax=Haloarchaeobius sp. TZWWS8 TaxID=3446121 RepID=UPI003EB94F82